jgi:hypothetical protein
MFSSWPRKQSVGAADPKCPRLGKDLWAARGERSERPVARPDAVAQADQAGKGEAAGTSAQSDYRDLTTSRGVKIEYHRQAGSSPSA